MADLKETENLFFAKTGMDQRAVDKIVGNALKGCDDGELYLEYAQSENFLFDDGRIKNASFDTSQGFGLRAVSGETTCNDAVRAQTQLKSVDELGSIHVGSRAQHEA